MPDLTGQKLGGYELAALLSRGGIVEAYRGHHPGSVQEVAVTVLQGCLVDDEAFLERFRREARLAAALRHGNIVRVLGFDVAIANGEALPYLVTELADGITLKQRKGRSPLPHLPMRPGAMQRSVLSRRELWNDFANCGADDAGGPAVPPNALKKSIIDEILDAQGIRDAEKWAY